MKGWAVGDGRWALDDRHSWALDGRRSAAPGATDGSVAGDHHWADDHRSWAVGDGRWAMDDYRSWEQADRCSAAAGNRWERSVTGPRGVS